MPQPIPGQDLALEPIGGTDSSLGNYIRSLTALTGTTGTKAFTTGQAQTSAGLADTRAGTRSAAPALDLLTKLTKGDQGDVTQAAQPEIDQITQQFDAIRNLVSMQPRGGGKATALAEAPGQKAAAIQRTEGAMRTDAAGKLGSLSTNLAGIGLGEAGVGISESGLGAELEQLSSTLALGKGELNTQDQAAVEQMIGGIGQGLGSLIGGLIARKP